MTRVCMTKPASRGAIRLRSAAPEDRPSIDARYLTEAIDIRRTLAGIRIAREIVAQKAFDAVRGEELAPGCEAHSLAALDRFCLALGAVAGDLALAVLPLEASDADLQVGDAVAQRMPLLDGLAR